MCNIYGRICLFIELAPEGLKMFEMLEELKGLLLLKMLEGLNLVFSKQDIPDASYSPTANC
jgi:hypothetical protein